PDPSSRIMSARACRLSVPSITSISAFDFFLFHIVRSRDQLATIIELGSVTRTAERLNLTQPTLSRTLWIIEDKVGGAVLRRDRYGVTRTDKGSAIPFAIRCAHGQIERRESSDCRRTRSCSAAMVR
ncbi:MAG: hypothetical protein CMP94_06540, partial [Gammaproteobacteria bacterium]|nr:hypothetical protein [Gammaproteobacteria bacterium]